MATLAVRAVRVGVGELSLCQLGHIPSRTFWAPRAAPGVDKVPFASSFVPYNGTACQAAHETATQDRGVGSMDWKRRRLLRQGHIVHVSRRGANVVGLGNNIDHLPVLLRPLAKLRPLLSHASTPFRKGDPLCRGVVAREMPRHGHRRNGGRWLRPPGRRAWFGPELPVGAAGALAAPSAVVPCALCKQLVPAILQCCAEHRRCVFDSDWLVNAERTYRKSLSMVSER